MGIVFKRRPTRLTHSPSGLAEPTLRRALPRSMVSVCLCALLLLAFGADRFGSTARAQDTARSALLLRMLATSPSFRVRAQAAMALSHMPADRNTLSVLKTALGDDHPVVRKAAETALASLDGGADRQPEAPAARPARYYVQVITPSTKAAVSASTLREMREHVVRLVTQLDGVRLAPEAEGQAAAKRVLQRDSLVGISVESVVNSIERRSDSVRVNVAVVVATYPGRNIQAMLTGSASVSGRGNGGDAERKAAEVAFASALRSLPSVLNSNQLEASASVSARRR